MSPTIRITAAALAIGLVAYAGWLLVRPDATAPEVTEPKSARTPRKQKPDAKPTAARPRNSSEGGAERGPERARPVAGAAPESETAGAPAQEMPPETARLQLKVLVEDIEAKADRGDRMSQPEWIALYKRGNELAQTLAKGTDPADAGAQKESGDLNARFRIGIAKVQPKSP